MTINDWMLDAAREIVRAIKFEDDERESVAAIVLQIIDNHRPKPVPPLLQCVSCGNTESPAGAMARQFNHGRCVHCGGSFKVVRA